MKRQKHINYLIFAILILTALTACSNGETTDIATPPPLTPTITPTEGPTATPTLVLPDTLVVCMGEEPGTLEEEYQPYLIQQGLLARTPQGRVAAESAYSLFGLMPPEKGRAGGDVI